MSESTLSSGERSPAETARRRQFLVLALVAVVAAAGIVSYLLLSGGGSSGGSTTGAISPASPRHSAATASPSAAPTGIPAVYNGPAGHNPFKPLVVPPPPSTTASTSASASASASPSISLSTQPVPTPTIIVLPPPTPTPTPTVTVTATPSPTGLPTAPAAQTLTLVDVDFAGGQATVTVNGTSYQPKDDQVFGKYFKLVSVIQGTDPSTGAPTLGADFEYGDQFVQLTKGESTVLG